MKKTQEQIFLQVKERLDYYRLPTIFPYQAVDLLSELLNLLDRNVRKNGKENLQLNNVHSQNQLNQAARLQIGKVVKENNKLHLDLISAKEEIITLKHNNDKYLIERSGGNKETVLLIQAQRRRQDELFDQLTRVKFKYNQLMDLVHQDSEIQKKYLKRLMKHQRMEITQKNYSPENSQSKKGPHQTTTDLQAKIILLQNKIANREAQIMRLQKRSQYDGLNMNKILKDFQNSRTDNKVSALQQQINYLEEENKKMKKQVNDCRKKGGSKQALRQQMRKNHQTIQNIAKQNKQLKRKLKIKDFDVEARSKQGQRQIQKSKIHALNKQEQSEITRLENGDLKKKIQFLEGQLKAANLNIQKQGRKIQESQILFEKIKNSQEGDKILAQYQIQSLKQKAEQLQSQLQNKLQRIRQLEGENIYHKKQDKLKNQAIENLQKIVDQLMRRNNLKQINLNQAQYQSNTLQNTIALRKNLGQMKQQLAITQNDKAKLERELQTLLIRFDKISQQNANLNNDYNKLRVRFAEIKNNQQQFSILQRQITTLQSDLKKEQNFRYKIDQLHQEAENDKTRLRKQLQGVTQQYQIYERKTKNHLNTLKTQVNELQQSNQMFELIGKEKDKKILVMQAQIDQLLGRIKLLKQQTSLLEDQKLAAIRQKHKYEKRCQQMLRVSNQAASTTSKTHQYKLNELHTQLIEYQNQIKRLHEKIAIQNEQINQLNSYCDAVKSSQQNIARQKNQIKHEYDILRNRLSRQSANGGNQQEEE